MLGTREKWIDTPCGITIKSKNINICDNVRDSLGGVGQQLIRQTTAMCQCIPQALDLIGKGLINEVAASSDVSSATSSILGQFAKLQTVSSRNSLLCDTDSVVVLLGQFFCHPRQQGRAAGHRSFVSGRWMDGHSSR